MAWGEGYFVDTKPSLKELAVDTKTTSLPNGDEVSVKTLSRLPDWILVWIPGATVQYGDLPVGVVPIPPTGRNIYLHGRRKKHHVKQFNVRHCYAFTVHRLQGLEAKGGLVVGCFNKRELNHIYVLLSRIRSWDKLHILPFLKVTKGDLTVKVTEAAYPRMLKLRRGVNRLETLAANTTAQFNAAKPDTSTY